MRCGLLIGLLSLLIAGCESGKTETQLEGYDYNPYSDQVTGKTEDGQPSVNYDYGLERD